MSLAHTFIGQEVHHVPHHNLDEISFTFPQPGKL